MTTLPNADEARSFAEANSKIVERFANYMANHGVRVQLSEVVARDFFGSAIAINGTVPGAFKRSPLELVNIAVQDVLGTDTRVGTMFDLTRVLNSAPSLEFLVRHAKLISPHVIPANALPSDELVTAALVIFHDRQI